MIRDKKKLITIIKIALLLAVGAVLFFTGKKVGAATVQPGSQSDPLVTLSYLEKRLGEGVTTSANGSGAGFEVVSLASGDRITLNDGAEAVVIRGNGTVFGQGLISITGGEMFTEGTSVVLYSDYLAAGTGCGIKASGMMKIYVKGGFLTSR
jgi:hypothetical protein